MSAKVDKYPELEPENFYHVYNRANGSEKVFLSEENYRFFLRKYSEHIMPVAQTFSYCLMPNHFHFLVQIKSEKEIRAALNKDSIKTISVEKLVSKQFSNLFSSYTQAFNKQQNRMGSLFMKNFKRIRVNDELYRQRLVHYIHLNPVEAGLCNMPHQWDFSSYIGILTGKRLAFLDLGAVEWFGDEYNFKLVHSNTSFSGDIII
jgi:putative transposase